jgi:ribonucleoside-diphosphate reductase beta chain
VQVVTKDTKVSDTPLFNPDADTSNTKMFTGESTGLIDMIDPAMPNFYQRHTEKMHTGVWHPIKYSVSDDIKDFNDLTAIERETLDKCLSHLTSLDSLQVNNLPEIAKKIRYPEVVGVLAWQEKDESLHSFSYAYIFNSLYSKEEARRVRDLIKTDPVMRARALEIKDAYLSIDDNTLHGQLKILLTNMVLESVMFYSIFNFFFSLKYKGKMINNAIVISWIKKDEVNHIDIFADILNKFKTDYPEVWDEDFVVQFLKDATVKEAEYSSYLISEKNVGFSKENILQYTQHRCNKVFRLLGLSERYENVKNPYLHLERISNIENVDSSETGIFEAHSTNYFDPALKIKDYKEFIDGK